MHRLVKAKNGQFIAGHIGNDRSRIGVQGWYELSLEMSVSQDWHPAHAGAPIEDEQVRWSKNLGGPHFQKPHVKVYWKKNDDFVSWSTTRVFFLGQGIPSTESRVGWGKHGETQPTTKPSSTWRKLWSFPSPSGLNAQLNRTRPETNAAAARSWARAFLWLATGTPPPGSWDFQVLNWFDLCSYGFVLYYVYIYVYIYHGICRIFVGFSRVG